MRQFSFLFAGIFLLTQTAIAEVMLTPVASGLSNPVYIHHAGDARLFVVEQPGRIKIIENGTVLPTLFLGISGRVTSGGERGLLSMAFHPDYDTNGFFYVNYTDVSGDTVISRFERSDADPNVADENSEVILLTINQPQSNHNGGQIQIGPDGYLYIGMGDGGGGGDLPCNAQSDDTLLGKMLRLDITQNLNTEPYYGIPPTNPYVGAGDPLDEIWAKGLRNPWRFSFDRQTGDLWIADVGQGQWEEINHVSSDEAGLNYGWRIMEGTHCYTPPGNAQPCPPGTVSCNDPSLTIPVHEYSHAASRCSVTGGYVYRGAGAPSLQGLYLFGDYCTSEIWTLDPSDNSVQVLFESQAFGLTSFGEGADGELYAAISGTIYRFEEPTVANGWAVY